jgi:hypothetical protein
MRSKIKIVLMKETKVPKRYGARLKIRRGRGEEREEQGGRSKEGDATRLWRIEEPNPLKVTRTTLDPRPCLSSCSLLVLENTLRWDP